MWNSAYKGSATNAAVTNHIVRTNPQLGEESSTFDVGEDTTITIYTGEPDFPVDIWVRAVNASGGIGNEAGPITIRTAATGEPGDVGGLRFNGIVGESNIPIDWASSADELGGANISGYYIEYDAA
jgi:hypothetical protein